MVHEVIVCIVPVVRCTAKVATERVPVAQVYIFEAGIENNLFVFYPFGVEQNSQSPL